MLSQGGWPKGIRVQVIMVCRSVCLLCRSHEYVSVALSHSYLKLTHKLAVLLVYVAQRGLPRV